MHRWDAVRRGFTEWPSGSQFPVHESVFRSYQILQVVKEMLARGDSPETIRAFVEWAESEDVTPAA